MTDDNENNDGMSDEDLKKILRSREIPEADEKRRKNTLDRAMEAYDKTVQKKNQKKSQGLNWLSRLMGITNQNRRQDMSNKKLVYGGMATALGVVLAAGVMFYQGNISFDTQDRSTLAQMGPEESEQGKTGDTVSSETTSQELRQAPVNPQPKAQAQAEALSSGAAVSSDMAFSGNARAPSSVQQRDVKPQQWYKDQGRDNFEDFEESTVKLVEEQPVSTFSADVDTSSYSFIRQRINSGVLPQKDAVRTEEMINYFDYDYPLPEDKTQPFKPSVNIMSSPWAEGKKLMHIGIKGYDIPKEERPNSNLVFLLDVSGSMNNQNKLPLLKNSFKLLLDQLGENDTISIVVYAGAAGTVLEPTSANEKSTIINALENLKAGGSTAGGEGIRQAYQLAEQNFDKNKVNRVILATDGDFNVGIRDSDELQDFVERKRESGIFLSVFGFGQGNYNDEIMQALAQNGNGVAAYIDTLNEAQKVLVDEAASTLFPIAKDVKIQVEFNPDTVSEYRLIGYETRQLDREDFKNDKVDAGDIGAGHSVTAIYELTPVESDAKLIEGSRYDQGDETFSQKEKANIGPEFKDEYAFLKIRYKLPEEDTSKLITTPITKDMQANEDDGSGKPIEREFRFATAVAGFGQLLKDSKFVSRDFTYQDVIDLAQSAKGPDPFGYRSEFIQLVRLAKSAADLPRQR